MDSDEKKFESIGIPAWIARNIRGGYGDFVDLLDGCAEDNPSHGGKKGHFSFSDLVDRLEAVGKGWQIERCIKYKICIRSFKIV